MRLRKRGGLDAADKRYKQSNRPTRPEGDLGLGLAARAARPVPNEQARPQQPKILKRQDYADIYQVGRRSSAPQRLARNNARRGLRLTNPRPLLLLAAVVLVVAAAVFGVTLLSQHPAQTKGEQVFFDGRMLCIAQNRGDVDKALKQIKDDLKATYGMEIENTGVLTYVPVSCDSQNILGLDEIKKALKANIDVKVVASVIEVDGRPAVALHTASEAQQALDAVLASYRDAPPERYRTDIAFVENVQVVQVPIDYALVQEQQDATRTLALGAGVEDNYVDVKKGDSLARIAKNNRVKVSDLKKANPALSINDVIQPGQTLNAVKPQNWVNVRYTETITREETLPFKTTEQPSDTLYTTQKKNAQDGKNGKREVVAKVTFINGMEAAKEIMAETVLEAAQDQIVLRGTKKVPTNSGVTVSTGKFGRPLSSYSITSTFGPRTLGGAAGYHYGYDLAAPTGTPIYATASGTVYYSGSASGYGLVIYLDNGSGIQSRYGHCSKLLVKKGQHVNKGQIIALVGSTGHSTGPHCHFEIRVNGTAVDPTRYVKLR